MKSVMVLPSDPAVSLAETVQFSAVATYSNGTTEDVTGQAQWQSSNPAVATVDASGLALAVDDGSALISAVFSGITGSSGLMVNVTLTSLALLPGDVTLAPGGTQQFTMTGTYSDGSTEDLTNAVAWKSSDYSVVTIDESGLATALRGGTAAIAGHTSTLIEGAAATVTEPVPQPPIGSTPCERLANALAQLNLLMTGRQVRSVETPQLGKVEYQPATVQGLQLLINRLRIECAESQGLDTWGMRRRPVSMEAEP